MFVTIAFRAKTIEKFERFLIKNKIMDKEDMEKIMRQVEKEVDEAHAFSHKSSYPKNRELTIHVFKE